PEQIDQQLDDSMQDLSTEIEGFIKLGSGWILKSVDVVRVGTASYNPIGGSSYIKTPRWIADTKAVVNIQNSDEMCFLYSILAFLHKPKTHTEGPLQYLQYFKELNYTDLTFPMKIADIPKFEHQNPTLSIYVLELND